jgi:hypothetical protein
MAPSSFADMYDSSPAALAKMRTPNGNGGGGGGRGGNDDDTVAASLGTAFSAMMTTPNGNGNGGVGGPTPYNTPAPGGPPPPPAISFAEMFGASPAQLAKIRSAHDAAGPG